jgi:hypothetical protein
MFLVAELTLFERGKRRRRDVGGWAELRAAARKVSDPKRALVAQLAEQGTLNPKVEGSIPSERIRLSGTSKNGWCRFAFCN